MKTFVCILVLLLAGQNCKSQDKKDVQFLKGIYAHLEEYSVWDDTIHSFQYTDTLSDSTGAYFFFSSVYIKRKGDTLKLTANIGNIFKVINLVPGKEEWMLNMCRPYIELTKIEQDSCWRGIYISESTGKCNATMTVRDGNIRIAGIETTEPFVFFAHYKIARIKKEIEIKIRKYIFK